MHEWGRGHANYEQISLVAFSRALLVLADGMYSE